MMVQEDAGGSMCEARFVRSNIAKPGAISGNVRLLTSDHVYMWMVGQRGTPALQQGGDPDAGAKMPLVAYCRCHPKRIGPRGTGLNGERLSGQRPNSPQALAAAWSRDV
jgi:hypothetical protein